MLEVVAFSTITRDSGPESYPLVTLALAEDKEPDVHIYLFGRPASLRRLSLSVLVKNSQETSSHDYA
jgi:hypothetical protein